MTLQQKHVKIATFLLWLLYCLNLSSAEIYLQLAARNIPNLDRGGDLSDPYVWMSENEYDRNNQRTETVDNKVHLYWATIIKVHHGSWLWFKAWDYDNGWFDNDDAIGQAHVNVADLHYLEINDCYRYMLERGDTGDCQYLLLKRVDSGSDRYEELNCNHTIIKTRNPSGCPD